MGKIYGVLLALSISGCGGLMAPRTMVDMNEAYLMANVSKAYGSSKEACGRAVISALTDLGAEIQQVFADRDEVETNRFRLTAYAVGSQGYARAIEEHQKIRVRVTGSATACQVSFVRYRTWVDGEENTKTNEDFVRKKMFDPFFRELDLQLESEPSTPKAKPAVAEKTI